QLAGHRAQQVGDVLDLDAVYGGDQILRAQAGPGRRAVGDDLDDFDTASATELRRQRPWAARDPDPRAPVAAVGHQRADDAPRRVVDRHREPEPDARDGGVDPDDAAESVSERAARVAGVQRRVGLDDVV